MTNKEIEERYDNLIKTGDLIAKSSNQDLNDKENKELLEGLNKINEQIEEEDEMEDYIPTKEDMELEKNPTPLYVQMDPYSGKINNVVNQPGVNTYDQDLDKLLSLDFEQIKSDIDIDEESVKKSINEVFPHFNVTDFKTFMNILDRYRKGEKFSYFNALPESMKSQIDLIIGGTNIGFTSTKEARNYVIESLFEQIIQDNYSNRMFVDIEKSLQNSYDEMYDQTKGQFSDYNNSFRDLLENQLPKDAEKIKDSDPEKAKEYMAISKAFTDSYTFKDMYEMYKNTGKLKVKSIMVEKFKRTCDDWCLKYKDHKMIINNVYDLYPALQKMFQGYGFDDIIYKKFICVFINYTKNMKPDNVAEHVFMYYFIKNIIGINFCNMEDEKEVSFCNIVFDNVNNFLSLIKEKDEAKNV